MVIVPQHGTSASAIGYIYQTNWALLELLRVVRTKPVIELTM
jgi:hypothetical protein